MNCVIVQFLKLQKLFKICQTEDLPKSKAKRTFHFTKVYITDYFCWRKGLQIAMTASPSYKRDGGENT